MFWIHSRKFVVVSRYCNIDETGFPEQDSEAHCDDSSPTLVEHDWNRHEAPIDRRGVHSDVQYTYNRRSTHNDRFRPMFQELEVPPDALQNHEDGQGRGEDVFP